MSGVAFVNENHYHYARHDPQQTSPPRHSSYCWRPRHGSRGCLWRRRIIDVGRSSERGRDVLNFGCRRK